MLLETQMPESGLGLLLLVFVLGLKHGLDPDHLATIDGLARVHSVLRPRLSKWAGLLFSLGHGATVIVSAGLISWLAQAWQVPSWFEALGAWVSISFLLVLGATNLYVVLAAPAHQTAKLIGVGSRLLRSSLAKLNHPAWIVLVGALFALSFDTMSQVAFFAISAQTHSSWFSPMLLGLVFMLGMIVTDGLNGFWVARMLQRSDQLARIATRVLGLTVAGLSLAVGLMGLIRQLAPEHELLTSVSPLQQGIGVIVVVLTSFALAVWLSRVNKHLPV